MRMYDIIAKKRDGGTLNHEELSFAVNGYVAGDVPDYQMSALLMAIYLRGTKLNKKELATIVILGTLAASWRSECVYYLAAIPVLLALLLPPFEVDFTPAFLAVLRLCSSVSSFPSFITALATEGVPSSSKGLGLMG